MSLFMSLEARYLSGISFSRHFIDADLAISNSICDLPLALANSGSFLDPKNTNPTSIRVMKAFSYAMNLSRWRFYYIIKLKIIGNSGGEISSKVEVLSPLLCKYLYPKDLQITLKLPSVG
jgi:hypothetical protein